MVYDLVYMKGIPTEEDPQSVLKPRTCSTRGVIRGKARATYTYVLNSSIPGMERRRATVPPRRAPSRPRRL